MADAIIPSSRRVFSSDEPNVFRVILAFVDADMNRSRREYPSPVVRPVVARALSYRRPFLALRHVSKEWKSVVDNYGELWATVVARLDNTPSIQLRFETHLNTIASHSQSESFEVYIIRGNAQPQTFDLSERRNLVRVFEALRPYLHRFRSLVVEANQSSTIPPAMQFIGPHMASLRYLVLKYNIDDSLLPSFSDLDDSEVNWSQLIPRWYPLDNHLTTLLLSGRQLIKLLAISPSIQELTTALRHLKVIGVWRLDQATEGFNPLFLLKYLRLLANLEGLAMVCFQHVDVVFHHPSSEPRVEFSTRPKLAITHSRSGTLRYLFEAIYIAPTRLYIGKCTFAHHIDLPSSPSLILNDISTQDTHFATSVAAWIGHDVEFQNCDALTAVFFRSLANVLSAQSSADQILPQLRRLSIQGCSKFSCGDLQAFLSSRYQRLVDDNLGVSLEHMRLPVLKVDGYGPSLTLEDAQELTSTCRTVEWSSIEEDGVMYCLDQSGPSPVVHVQNNPSIATPITPLNIYHRLLENKVPAGQVNTSLI